MAADDWYRQTEWTVDGAALFEKKIARARSQKAQYLALQAFHLLDARPDVSLKLLERAQAADAMGYETARIHYFRAEANLRLGRIEEVLAAYKQSMKAQRDGGVVFTPSALDYAFVVAYFGIEDEYDEALSILERFPGSPIGQTNAQAWGSHALILADRGEKAAQSRARDALAHLGDDREALVNAPPQRNGIVILHFVTRLEKVAVG